jgi:NADPH:quinone reductase-like Zn-dependent oxidoreductase
MKAWVVTRYGGPEVLELREVPTPVAERDEVLIRVHATTVTAGDRRIRAMDAPYGFGFLFPLIFGKDHPKQPILGSEVAGIVEATGPEVTRYKAGDRVFAYSDAKMKGHAEYLAIRETGAVWRMPDGMDFTQAVALSFGPCTALAFLKKTRLRRGQRVLVNGASGNVGSAALQLAKHLGAHVTAVTSAANAELARSIGADAVIDYQTQDFARTGQRWDVIFDAVGNLTFPGCRPALATRGKLVLASAALPDMLKAPFQSLGLRKVHAGPTGGRRQDLQLMAQLAADGFYKPVIDRVLPFEEMREAHRVADSGRKRGSVVATL